MLTNMLPNRGNGTFRVHAIAVDTDGQSTLLGSRTIVAENDSSIRPFGTIDTPGQGDTISGTAYAHFGWALTPAPKLIPVDGSTISVIIGATSCTGAHYEGQEQLAGGARGLPVGSTLDAARGIFTWQPGPGFIGRYQLVFTRHGCGADVVIPIEVVLHRTDR